MTFQVRGEAGKRDYNQGYIDLLKHFGMKPRRIHIGSPEQNGDIESSNGGLKRALRQHLLLRGSRDFATLTAYEQFVESVMAKRNEGRQKRLAKEMAVMPAMQAKSLSAYQEIRVKVNRGGLVRVQNNSYSVPTGLIGKQVRVRIYEWHLEVRYANRTVETIARLVGQNKQQINYRHLIDSLLRKPGGFRNYRYREAFFPGLVFRQAWEQLQKWHSPRKADLIYLRVLNLAAKNQECAVAAALKALLAQSAQWDETDVKSFLQPQQAAPIPLLEPAQIDLSCYDSLLQEVA